jgi:hypothetical protein
MRLILSALVFFSATAALAKTIVRGDPAQLMYQELISLKQSHPETVASNTNMFFGDDLHPERGRLWLTTVYKTENRNRICYQYDYREVAIIDYMCEVY